MRVIYTKPLEDEFKYNRWFDNNGTFDIWYKNVVSLHNYQNLDIPNELKLFLDKWNSKILEYKGKYIEQYPVKFAKIEFIYNDTVYALYPMSQHHTKQAL